MSNPIIRVNNLSKRYRIGAAEKGYKTFREAIMEGLSAPVRNFSRLRGLTRFKNGDEADVIWALKDVSFEVNEGEVLGIIGKNGAGKTTILKILSRITEPSSGYAEIRGRVSSLLEVGTGFHPELTGRENIFLNGAILGMRKREIEQKFDDIVGFAEDEVEKYIDTPVKRYSSGMSVRLAFAVAAHLEPEILLVDEVLAVGDIAFQKKCLGKMEDVAKGGRTVLFVSHNMGAVSSLCTRCIRLESGTIVDNGSAASVIRNYLRSLEVTAADETISDDKRRLEYIQKSGVLKITNVSFMNSKGENNKVLFYKEPFSVHLIFEVKEQVDEVRLGLGISAPDGTRISTTHHTDGGLTPLNLKKGRYSATVHVQNSLTPGSYMLVVGAHDLKNRYGLEYVPVAAAFTVMDLSENGMDIHDPDNIGFANLSFKWSDMNQAEEGVS
jgi:lipopolysaccharide transport system ATP-binding protein